MMEELIIRFFQAIPVLPTLAERTALVWPIAEVFHFLGLTLLVGAIGVLDLRMLGMARALTPAAVHRVVPVGVLGFGISLASGMVFVAANPAMFIRNPMFQLKMLFIALAGANVVYFYLFMFRKAEAAPAGADLPLGAKIAGGVSVTLWMGVILAGRYMAWF